VNRHRYVESDKKRPYVRLAGFAAGLGVKTLRLNVETDNASDGHGAVHVWPDDANIPKLNAPGIGLYNGGNMFRSYAEDVWTDERDGKRRKIGKLQIHALVAFAVAREVIAVMQTRDPERGYANTTEKEVDRHAVSAKNGLHGVGAFAVIEPNAAQSCAAAETKRSGIALEHDVRRDVRANS
jgi:hypothetical protein